MICERCLEFGDMYDRGFWALGYNTSTIVNVDETKICKYIREQEEESKKHVLYTTK